MDTSQPLMLDIAVIGGGIAGAYSAWRLQKNKVTPESPNIALFEYSNRIGGRLLSRTMPQMPNVVAELGGMRYIPESQPLVTQLIEVALQLPTEPFPMGNPDPTIGASQNYYYLRGKNLTLQELSEAGKIPYNVHWQEKGKNPTEIQKYIMDLYVPNADKLSFEQWFDVQVFGKPMYQIGYWNFLSQVLSNEAFAFMRDAGGYDANVANASTIAQLPVSDFGSETTFKKITKGYQSLPITLVEQFEQAGGQLFLNKKLISIVKQADGSFELLFKTTTTTDFKTKDAVPEQVTRVLAKKVILALPRRALELISWRQFQENDFLKKNLKSVLIQHAFKLFLAYDYAWWRSLNLWAGAAVTDLPIRQTYYFGVEGEQKNTQQPHATQALLMASYNDISTVPYWKGYEKDVPYAGKERAGVDASPASEYLATQSMVEAAHRQVMELHGLKHLDKPYSAIFHDWSGEPYGGGWHEWKAGFRYDKIISKMIKPVEADNVFIIGEAYSNNQGWVEGSLETAFDMMKRFFKLTFLPDLNDDKS